MKITVVDYYPMTTFKQNEKRPVIFAEYIYKKKCSEIVQIRKVRLMFNQ